MRGGKSSRYNFFKISIKICRLTRIPIRRHKTTSYKYATMLAIFDFIIDHPSELPVNNLHFIPIDYLARQFISYYYPFSFHNFYQCLLAADKSLKVLNYIDEFKLKIRSEGGVKNKILRKIPSPRKTWKIYND